MTGRGDNVRSYLNTSFLTMKVPAMDDSRPSSADSFRMDTSSIVTSDGSTSFDEDEQRRQKKKELNRLAAQRSREKRRNLIKQLEEQVSGLETTNTSLTSEISSMRREVSQLDHMLQNHECIIQNQS